MLTFVFVLWYCFIVDTEQIYVEIGKRVREARRNKHLTQERLAEIVSVTRTSITNIEKGRQKVLVHSLYNLAAALGVAIDYLLPEKTVEKGSYRMPSDLSNEEQKWVKLVMKGGEQYGSKNKKKRN